MGGLPAVVSVAGLELNYDGSVPPILHISTSGRGYWDRLVAPDAALSGLSLSLATVMGSRKVTGMVTINKAVSHDITIPLANTNPAATCPSSVTIPAGATYVQFTLTTVVVTTSKSGYVSAAYNGVTLTQPLTVRPISVGSITLSPNPVVGGKTVAGSVKLEAPAAPGKITVILSSNNTQVAYPTVSSLTLPAGASSATFTIKTRVVHVQNRVSIQAQANGITKSKLLTVRP
jgi:hypothetical protein